MFHPVIIHGYAWDAPSTEQPLWGEVKRQGAAFLEGAAGGIGHMTLDFYRALEQELAYWMQKPPCPIHCIPKNELDRPIADMVRDGKIYEFIGKGKGKCDYYRVVPLASINTFFSARATVELNDRLGHETVPTGLTLLYSEIGQRLKWQKVISDIMEIKPTDKTTKRIFNLFQKSIKQYQD
jgi:hypothetical protein